MGMPKSLTRMLWFIGLWIASVAFLGLVAYLIKLVIL